MTKQSKAPSRRELFIDNSGVLKQLNVVQKPQPANKYTKPVLMPERPWEMSYHPLDSGVGKRVYVYGTVFYDSLQKQYRMWYMSRMSTRHNHGIPELELTGEEKNRNEKDYNPNEEVWDLALYAESKNGINWERPNLGQCHFDGDKRNNIFGDFHGVSVILDREEKEPQKRYKAIGFIRRLGGIYKCYSPDGIHWSKPQRATERRNEGSFNVCYVPHLGIYVAGSIERSSNPRYTFKSWSGDTGRKRVAVALATSSKDLSDWKHRTVIYPDVKDHPNTQFYGMTPFVYGDMLLGFLHVFNNTGPGPANDDGPIQAELIYSRDGKKWHRLDDRTPVIPVGPEGSTDGGMIMMTANGTFLHNDKIITYYTSANTGHGALIKDRNIGISRATWKRDRLVSMQSGDTEGWLETVPLETPKGDLEINADAEGGYIVVEVLDVEANVLSGFSSKECVPIISDDLSHKVAWKEADFSKIDQPVCLRFVMRNAKLFSFALFKRGE